MIRVLPSLEVFMTVPDDPDFPFDENSLGEERREAARFDLNVDTSRYLTAIVEGDSHLARVRNISTGGIGLIVSRKYEPGEQLFVQLETGHFQLSRVLEVNVVYMVEHPSGDWVLGGAFTEKLSGEELQQLLDMDWTG